MDDRKRNLKGSSTRDAFKHWHKQAPLPHGFYACDIDFALITKKPQAGIVAVLDYKSLYDRITFTEVIAYNDLIKRGIDVYIVSAEWHGDDAPEPFTCFTVQKYISGDWNPDPPKTELEMIIEDVSVKEYILWEAKLRNRYNEKQQPKRKSRLGAHHLIS